MSGVKAELYKLETMVHTGKYDDGWEIADVRLSINELKEKFTKIEKSINTKRNTLGADGRLNLERLLGNKFLRLHVNALALKQHLRNRLQQRKFELDSLERDTAKLQPIVSKKLQEHSESQIKRKEPGIQKLAKKYNNLCSELEKMIKAKQSPRGARAPHKIATEGLFKLDVDDDIWQDVGLDDTDLSSENAIPQWLGNEDVRKGIKALLELDRCKEELRRLSYERSAMQEWLIEEWQCVIKGIENEQDINIIYQLDLRASFLAHVCLIWQDKVCLVIPHKSMDSSWGPTLDDLAHVRKIEMMEMVADQDSNTETVIAVNDDDDDEDDEDDEDEEEEDGEELELLEAVELLALSDEFRSGYNS
ncbi:uncharacterized protein LACBIDRAFT_305654 [Laccaria bicolor S238N-H82]|uniref:Predicted protein n=1 Tax=Laccaria bicolor (strain S238N-H82 / ATCC MYA-4686) TaxID=486041 RepID=B0CUR3_LACBS|nr:uncharacterized protein LACBIDRAFT_305654 [Laccaria bicolor S238N-H82]EDR14713.1 predicted protein [Laccaria bicolor S238N-H82]|eukprot:XP_001875272.1 predicted protein [Laccaria bicolor S238N-H82]